ncbi:cutinase [Klenkia marina]|uniref:Cutinase n=1 Tax=Klenkia marina TaxID=1960309 RepID=A0A1G4XAA0_9ACTN|nr:cutinase family protein [Klenkia marina]SCX37824.1 cutinase [Klenkia marina]
MTRLLRTAVHLLTSTAVVGTALAATVVGTAAPAAAACADVDVVFARGTGETPGLGITGRPFVSALTSQLADRTVSSYAVDYAANSSQTSAGPGSADMSRHVSEVAAACPGTRFVLGGYSQGATVTDLAVGIRTGVSTGTPIPAALADRVVAVVVFGNPLGLSGGRTIATASPTYGPRSVDYCNSSDTVCGSQPKNGTGGHLSYASNGATTAGASFAAARVRAAGTPTTPTPGATCVTATPGEHVSADRAVSVYGVAYARGSRDRLGYTVSQTAVSLRQDGTASWSRVTGC